MSASIVDRIDQDLAWVAGIKSGVSAYAYVLDRYNRRHRTRGARRWLIDQIVDLAAYEYRRSVGRKVELLTFSDGAFQCLFDYTLERTILMYGDTRETEANTRDNAYHRGYPRREGMDKGHAMAHAQGGLEGGPNYFPQAAALNRGRHDAGKLWRAIETYLAANAGLFAFVRLIYAPGNAGDTPGEVEYGLLDNVSQFRSVIFPNT